VWGHHLGKQEERQGAQVPRVEDSLVAWIGEGDRMPRWLPPAVKYELTSSAKRARVQAGNLGGVRRMKSV